jgi:hypothetical protein
MTSANHTYSSATAIPSACPNASPRTTLTGHRCHVLFQSNGIGVAPAHAPAHAPNTLALALASRAVLGHPSNSTRFTLARASSSSSLPSKLTATVANVAALAAHAALAVPAHALIAPPPNATHVTNHAAHPNAYHLAHRITVRARLAPDASPPSTASFMIRTTTIAPTTPIARAIAPATPSSAVTPKKTIPDARVAASSAHARVSRRMTRATRFQGTGRLASGQKFRRHAATRGVERRASCARARRARRSATG